MTSTLVQGVGRSHGEPVRPLSVLALSPAIIVLLLGGLALRLTIAYVLFPASGFESDLASYASWAGSMAEFGPGGFYQNAGFSDYPPAYLYVLWGLGLLAGSAGDAAELVKLPPILLDIAVGYFIFRLVRGWTWPGPRSEALALVAAALYLFNPVSFYDSALWGQTDAAGALVLLLGLAALIRGNSEGAAAMAATAALVKPQFGVVLIPLVAAVLVKRHLLQAGSGPRKRPWVPGTLGRWLAREQGPLRLLTAVGVAWLAYLVIALPFGLGPDEYLERMFGTAGGYGYLSVNAFNLWALVGVDGQPSLADALRWNEDTLELLGPLPGLAIGATLLVAGFLWGVVRGAVRDDRWTLIVAITFLAIAFFILPTRVHERYIFPAVALMPLLAVVQRRWALALLLLSVGAFINLHAILTLPLYGSSNVETLPLGEWFRSQPLVVLSALLQTSVGLWAAWQLRPSLRTSPDRFDYASAPAGEGVPALAPPSSYPALPPSPELWVRGPGVVDQVVSRLSWGSLRRDRSATLAWERGGRLDRRDLLIVAVLAVLVLGIRGFRLDQPVRMYFDEVYHARTATEFLQQWQYGEPHDIYEFTHPHLAKYAMAWGIRLAGGNHITGSAELGVPVADTALERRWARSAEDERRRGDRLWVGTGSALRAYDLETDRLVAEVPLAAAAVAVDDAGHRLFVADSVGRLYRLDTTVLDGAPGGQALLETIPQPLSPGPGAPVERLLATDTSLVAATRGALRSFDPETGELVSERLMVGVTDLLELPWAERLVVDTRALPDREVAADLLAEALATDREPLAERLAAEGSVVIAAWLDESAADAVLALIEAGDLPGAELASAPLLAVADHSGVSVLDAWTLDPVDDIASASAVSALMLAEPASDEPTLYAAAGPELLTVPLLEDGPGIPETMWMPGQTRGLAWNESAGLAHVLGDAPEGGPTVYVVEPRGRSVFIDVPLPYEPLRLLADTQADRPDADRTQLLAVAADGSVTTIGIGGNAFGWRLPGVLLGVLGAALLYLLARVLFARRSIALIVAVLVVAEGMLFANSRIAMNDVYVTTFILLAALVFAPLYLAPRRALIALAIVIGAGLALGLALASKWVALYAIGGLGLLVLLRSALGRSMALLALMGMTAVLGAMAVRPADMPEPSRNWSFVLLMLLLTGLLAAAMVRRPLPFTRVEVLLAVTAPILAGLALVLLGQPLYGGLTVGAGALVALIALVVTWAGRGPFSPAARLPARDTSVWLRPGPVQFVPWLLTLGALLVLPIGTYVISYAPWVELGNAWGLPLLGDLPFLPESVEDGRDLADLTASMYQYHDNLRAEHAASSPWWAWPLDLKPVWFFQERYADGTTGLIYDAGNLVVFWLGIAGLAFSAVMAWRRRSLALTLVVVMWAALWLPWARIDRAAFQYHVYASLPFMLLALSYFLAELWHGPGARTWFLARVAGALAIIGVPLLWLLRTPLCILSGTAVARPEGVACAAEVTRTAQLSEGGVAAIFVLGVGAAVAGYLAWRASRAQALRPREDGRGGPWLAAIVTVALLTLGGVFAALLLLDTSSTTGITMTSDVLALMGLVVLGIPAWLTLRARDPRRFVLGVLGAAVLWLLVWYPNISGLPLPSEIAHLYQGLLPTWNWDFQFAVNTDPAAEDGIADAATLVIGAISVVFVVAVAVAARAWGRPSPPPSG